MRWRVWIEDKPSGKFLVRRRDSLGNNLPSKSCSTKRLANDLKKKWEKELEHRSLGLVNPDGELKEISDQYVEEIESSGRMEYAATFKGIFKHFLKDKKTVSDLTRQSILDYRAWLIKNRKPATVKSKLRHLSAWLSWCVEQGHLDESPFKKIKVPDYTPQPKYMTDAEMLAIDNAAVGKMKLAWRINITTGIRQGNLRKIHDTHIQNGMVIMQRTKGKRPLSAPLAASVIALLPARLPPGPLFPDWISDPNGRYALDREFRKLKAKAGVRKGITWHMGRHTFIKMALQSGLTTFEVMGFTGHVSPQSMVPYANFEMDRLKERHSLIKFPVKQSGRMVGK